MRLLSWLIRGLLFFTLFAFALNNQHDVTVRWFFGASWRSPLVIVVLAAFAVGCAIGVLAMVPSWWRHRRLATQRPAPAPVAATPTTEPVVQAPPREAL